MSTNILTILDQRNLIEERMKKLQTEIDEFYITLEKDGFKLYQEMSFQYSPRRFFWKKDKLASAKYLTEQAAVEAYLNNEIEWVKP